MPLRRLAIALGVLIVARPSLGRGQSAGEPSPVLRGEWALQRHEIGVAVAAFRAGAREPTARERATAERMLASIAHLYQRDDASARDHLRRALDTGSDTARTLAEWARVETEAGRYREAYQLAARAQQSAASDDDQRLAVREMGRAVVEEALAERVDGARVPASERSDEVDRSIAVELLRARVRALPGRPQESRLLLEAALLAGDGEAAREGWQSFQLLGITDTAGGPIPAMRAALDSLLPRWRGAATPGPDRRAIVNALERARFHSAAALIAPQSSQITAYVAFCRRLSREADEYYRETLMGARRPDELLRAYYRAAHDLWPHLAWPNGMPAFFPAAVAPELERRFGTVMNFGVTAGFYDLHMGHIVASEERTIEQYGRRVRLHFVTLDGMVTNGLQSWAWNGQGAHAGWQRGDSIVEVRPVYITAAFEVWESGSDGRRSREQNAIAADSVADWRRAARDSVSFFPSVAERLRRDGRRSLLDSLRAAGLQGPALASAFVSVVATLQRESAILSHEARHALDERLAPGLSPAEREFRAKLSEIGFAPRPKLMLTSIVHPNIGDATPHGQANARIMLGLIHWMRTHSTDISGLDTTGPMLPQLPLLSADQLRAAFRSMDPWAEHAGAARARDHLSFQELR